MVAKTGGARRRRKAEPLEVRLSLRFTFGDEPDDCVQMLSDRRVPLVGSVFESRDRILRNFAMLMVRAGAMQPKVVAEIFPALRLLTRLRQSAR